LNFCWENEILSKTKIKNFFFSETLSKKKKLGKALLNTNRKETQEKQLQKLSREKQNKKIIQESIQLRTKQKKDSLLKKPEFSYMTLS